MGVVAKGAGEVLYKLEVPGQLVPALVTVECERLPGNGVDPAGGPDADGLDLHLFFEVTRGPLDSKSDDAVAYGEYEFDAMPEVVLPRCGTLTLVGGVGLWRASFARAEKWPFPYQQQVRQLTRRLARDTSFRVPRGHTLIGSHNPGSTVVVDGDALALDGSARAISAGAQVISTVANLRLFTAILF